jgi:hypothetical protein
MAAIMARSLVLTHLVREKRLPSTKVVAEWLRALGWIQPDSPGGASWVLTAAGRERGARMVDTEHGSKPAWPEIITADPAFITAAWQWSSRHLIDAKDMARQTGSGVESWEINSLLAGLGWIEPVTGGGWYPTEEGHRRGGVCAVNPDHPESPHVRWPADVLEVPEVRDGAAALRGQLELASINLQADQAAAAGREIPRGAWPDGLRYRTDDGHFVRSKAEALIDNWLYAHGIAHAYEPPLPGGHFVGDFYLPAAKLYLEFWGLAGDPEYDRRRAEKHIVYAQHKLTLIDLTEEHMSELDSHLKRLLGAHSLPVY